ncbi:MAG: DUF134 domain-containing protein [Acidobacteria bacterium]|nr:DUF134 domain-containing protein [Acidobacteriota bacterium]
MPRPKSKRRVLSLPRYSYFLPLGTPTDTLQEIKLTIDELEAIRLKDYEGLYQKEAAKKMNVSRQTFGRILESARKKIAEALLKGTTITIKGGRYNLPAMTVLHCEYCGHEITVREEGLESTTCPSCGKKGFNIS